LRLEGSPARIDWKSKREERRRISEANITYHKKENIYTDPLTTALGLHTTKSFPYIKSGN
jgi:hypothetical protein